MLLAVETLLLLTLFGTTSAVSIFLLIEVKRQEAGSGPKMHTSSASKPVGTGPSIGIRGPEKSENDEEEELTPEGDIAKSSPRIVRLLITGFGPFPGVTNNPSTRTAKHLDGLVLTSPPGPSHASDSAAAPSSKGRCPVQIEITFLGPLDVSYTTVDTIIPPLHSSGKYDAVIHVGVASGWNGGVKLERRARKSGYESPGVDGKRCAKRGMGGGRGPPNWPRDGPEELVSKVDVEKCRDRVADGGVKDITTSMDAGLYLCEYIYATSLASSLISPKQAPVLFVHVPELRSEDDAADADPSSTAPKPSPKPSPTGGAQKNPRANNPPKPTYTEREIAAVLERVAWFVGNGRP